MRFMARKSLLYRYMITYIGIAIVACSIVGTILFVSATDHLNEQTLQAKQVRLDMSRDDLSNALQLMDTMALQVSTNKVFQPFFLDKGAINHMTMLEVFQRYQNYSALIQQYYLYYPNTDTVFSPTAEYRFYLFAGSILGMDPETAEKQIQSNVKIIPMGHNDQKFLLSFPIVFIQANSHSNAYLLFEVDTDALSKRFSTMFMLDTPVQITYMDHVLQNVDLGKQYLESRAELPGGELILRTTPSMDITIRFQTTALLVIIAVTFAISVFSAFVAWKTYLPIRRLASKIHFKDKTEKNEVKLIEGMMESLSEEKQLTMGQLARSLERITVLTSFLQKKIIYQLLSGEQEDGWEEHIQNCGMILNRPFLCALHIHVKTRIPLEPVLESVERNATADIAAYGIVLSQQDGIGVILSANESEELSAFCTCLQTNLFQEGFDVSVHHGSVVNRPSELPKSFCLAQSPQKDAENADTCYDVKDMEEIRQALRECDREKALVALDSILVDIMNKAPSMLMQRYYIVQLTYQIVSAGREYKILLPDEMVQHVIMAESSWIDGERLRTLLNRIFDERIPSVTSAPVFSEKNQQIVDYIKQHAFDYTMCLDLVADEFNISTKQVSRIVKSCCGETFKDFLLQLRMDKAIELLKKGDKISEVTTQIGYTDERYFKKRFFEFTGDSVMKYLP